MPSASPTATLIDRVGLVQALRIGALIILGKGGRPFAHLEPAQDAKERLSRAQAAMAIRLYRVLLMRLPPQRALSVAGDVISAGAVQHLRRTLGRLDGHTFAALDGDERARRVQGWIDRFFTATAVLDEVGGNHVAFTVTACALARLSRAAGHPELAPMFCHGDALFFSAQEPPITLERSQTLAEGASSCPFRLTLQEEGPREPRPAPTSGQSGAQAR